MQDNNITLNETSELLLAHCADSLNSALSAYNILLHAEGKTPLVLVYDEPLTVKIPKESPIGTI